MPETPLSQQHDHVLLESTTYLLVQDLLVPQWDHGIQGDPERQGGQWSLEGLEGLGGQLDQVCRWSLVLGASSGVQPTAQFALLENRVPSTYFREEYQNIFMQSII